MRRRKMTSTAHIAYAASATVVSLLLYRVWVDTLEYMYHRERMRTCVKVVHEGVGLVRHAIERNTLGELGDGITNWWFDDFPPPPQPSRHTTRR